MRIAALASLPLLLAAPLSFAESDGDPCWIPLRLQNRATHTEGNLIYTFAVDKACYFENEIINFHYVVENTGSESVYFHWGHDPQRAFIIYPDTCDTLHQPGCYDAAVFIDPSMIFYFSQGFTVEPGECKVFSQSWDQRQNTFVEPGPGSYRVFSGLYNVTDWPGEWVGESGLSVEIVINPVSVENEHTTWGAIKALYL